MDANALHVSERVSPERRINMFGVVSYIDGAPAYSMLSGGRLPSLRAVVVPMINNMEVLIATSIWLNPLLKDLTCGSIRNEG